MLQRNINETTVATVLDPPTISTAGWVQLSCRRRQQGKIVHRSHSNVSVVTKRDCNAC